MTSTDRIESFQRAVAWHQNGQLEQAEAAYRELLRNDPGHVDALYNLGLIALQNHYPAQAGSLLLRVLQLRPADPNAWLPAIEALIRSNQLSQARQLITLAQKHQHQVDLARVQALQRQLDLLTQILDLQQRQQIAELIPLAWELTVTAPSFPQPWNILGALRLQQGNALLAIEALQMAIMGNSHNPPALSNLGVACYELKRYEEAAYFCSLAIQQDARFASAYNNLGNSLRKLRRYPEAEQALRGALELQPRDPEVMVNLSNVLIDLGKNHDGLDLCLRAKQLAPGRVSIHNNLALIQLKLGKVAAATRENDLALRLAPNSALAHINKTTLDIETQNYAQAEHHALRAIRLDPELPEAHNNLGYIQEFKSQLADAEVSFLRALQLNPDFLPARSNYLLHLNYHNSEVTMPSPEFSPQHYGQKVATIARTCPSCSGEGPNTISTSRPALEPTGDLPACPQEPGSFPLRIGFVSGDFNDHPVGRFLESVLIHLDRSRFQCFAYYNQAKSDAITARLKPHFQAWHSIVGMSDPQACSLIRSHQLHILFDLSGHSANNRLPLFAHKPAPVQISWLGYFATTGVTQIDYFLADPWLALPGEQQYFCETLWPLPESWFCMTPPLDAPPVNNLPALTNGFITFGCFNNLAKLNPVVLALWARILKQLPSSRLVLKTKALKDPAIAQLTLNRFAQLDIDSQRLTLLPGSPTNEYLVAYHTVDIALDPFPYPGGTISVDALWMGVPVLTLNGKRFLSRLGTSINQNAGLPDWIALTQDEYVEKALYSVNDLAHLNRLRLSMREHLLKTPLFNPQRFTQNFQNSLLQLWQEHLEPGHSRPTDSPISTPLSPG